MSIKNNFALYFRNTYNDTNDTQMFDSETYDKLANFFLNYTKDDKKTSSKYPHFKCMKILTGDDVYSPNECEEEDKQVYLYNLYKKNHINKEIFVKAGKNIYSFIKSIEATGTKVNLTILVHIYVKNYWGVIWQLRRVKNTPKNIICLLIFARTW